jgi:hypothetical protein
VQIAIGFAVYQMLKSFTLTMFQKSEPKKARPIMRSARQLGSRETEFRKCEPEHPHLKAFLFSNQIQGVLKAIGERS